HTSLSQRVVLDEGISLFLQFSKVSRTENGKVFQPIYSIPLFLNKGKGFLAPNSLGFRGLAFFSKKSYNISVGLKLSPQNKKSTN
ncbi:hypothetical protein, partial [Methanoculleus sp.]|uniref:hypothetical protein n=1 Tax=Methanoculleus sp. TaxID=90427 RepID=UPI0025F11B8B